MPLRLLEVTVPNADSERIRELIAGAPAVHLGAAAGAASLAVTNVTAIHLAGVATFVVQDVRPRTWWEAARARRATRVAAATWLGMLGVLFCLMLPGLVAAH